MNEPRQQALPVVGVMGSGTSCDESRCEALGRWLASEGVHLLTGGGGGAMRAVSKGFFEVEDRSGLVVAVLPAEALGSAVPPRGYPNPWVELAIRTHLHLSGTAGTQIASRNHINVLSSNVIIALPGSWGTRSEVELALRYRRPVVAYLQAPNEIPELPKSVSVVRTLGQLQAFVRPTLGRAP